MLKQTLLVIFFLFCILMVLFYLFQRYLIYIPMRQTPELSHFKATDLQIVTLHTKDAQILTSWYKPAENSQPTILFLHGNAGHIGYRMPLARQFINAGFGVFLLEYRGYGGNKGSPNEDGLYEDARTALQFLHQRKIRSDQIALYGESLGTGVATKMASEYPVCAIVLQSPFASLVSLSRYHYPWILIKPWDRFDSLGRIKKIHSPLLVLHGKRDQLVPYEEGLTLFNQANEPKKMISYQDKDHHNMWNANGFSESIIHFVQTFCK